MSEKPPAIIDALRDSGVTMDEARLHTLLGTTLRGLGIQRKQRREGSTKSWGYQGIKRKPLKTTFP
jgi:hypothetical protein